MYELFSLKDFYCPAPEFKKFLVSSGQEFEPIWQYMEWTVKLRENQIDKPDVENWLKKYPSKVVIYYPDISIDQKNMTDPATHLLNSKYFHLSYSEYKKTFFEFSSIESFVNDNPAFDKYDSGNYYPNLVDIYNDNYLITNRTELRLLKNDHFPNLVRNYIFSSTKSLVFKRKTRKIQDYLTTIQFVSILLIIGQYCATYVNNWYLRKSMMKEVIKIRDIDYFLSINEKINKQLQVESQAKKVSSSSEEFYSFNNIEKKISSPIIKKLREPSNLNNSINIIEFQKKDDKDDDCLKSSSILKKKSDIPSMEKEKDNLKKINLETSSALNRDIAIESQTKEKSKISFHLFDILFCENSKEKDRKLKFLDQGNKYLDKNLNVFNFLKIEEEFSLMKDILFTKEEIEMINFINEHSIIFDRSVFANKQVIDIKYNINNLLKNEYLYKQINVRKEIFEKYIDKINSILNMKDDKLELD
jgi:hypothetical protein